MDVKIHIPPEGYHKHKCDECGCVWEHEDSCSNSNTSHTCPGCGSRLYGLWYKYFGPKAPMFTTFVGEKLNDSAATSEHHASGENTCIPS